MRIAGSLTIAVLAGALTACSGGSSGGGSTTITVAAPPVASSTTTAAPAQASAAQPSASAVPPAGSSPTAAQPAPPPAPSAPSYSADVASVQRALQGRDIYKGEINGILDVATVSAIKIFQRQAGLRQDGKAGPAFWDAINSGTGGDGDVNPPADPGPPAAADCGTLYAQWDAAVQANSRSRSQRAHDAAAAAGCRPNTWLPSRSKTSYDPNAHHVKGERCSMSEVGTYDADGNVCTQDVKNKPHWN